MMTNQEACDYLEAFFGARRPFAAAAELPGHASSRIPEVFLNWFQGLDPQDREIVVNALVSFVLVGDSNNAHVPAASALLAEMAAKYPRDFAFATRDRLEVFALRGENLSRWVEDQDSESEGQTDYRSRWRFALCLWNTLYALKSPRAQDLFEQLSTRSRDEFFICALNLAKRLRDNPGLVR
jgi:hypothetical protein